MAVSLSNIRRMRTCRLGFVRVLVPCVRLCPGESLCTHSQQQDTLGSDNAGGGGGRLLLTNVIPPSLFLCLSHTHMYTHTHKHVALHTATATSLTHSCFQTSTCSEQLPSSSRLATVASVHRSSRHVGQDPRPLARSRVGERADPDYPSSSFLDAWVKAMKELKE